MYYVYVIKNTEGNIYTGYTNDLDRRLESHNKGLNKSTKGHQWEYIYYEAYRAEKDARRREINLKKSGQARRWLKERLQESINS